jgi:hypothetical protein
MVLISLRKVNKITIDPKVGPKTKFAQVDAFKTGLALRAVYGKDLFNQKILPPSISLMRIHPGLKRNLMLSQANLQGMKSEQSALAKRVAQVLM